MTETQRKIKEYQLMLPGLRERVAAVAMLLVVSLTMVVSASFAWYTLSRAPEVTSVSTTVAANGNLEIALAPLDGSQPAESAVGDSFAVEGRKITEANLTWGNLVNLSDSSYGLSNIVLRPALLNTGSDLLDQPLKGADYGDDGRMELYYNEDFQFVNWVEPKNDVAGYFKYNDTPQYGVRAISTVEYTYVNNSYYQFTVLLKRATGARDATEIVYDEMITNQSYIDMLAGLIGDFMTDRLNDKNGSTDVSKYIPELYNLLCEFEVVVDSFSNALVELANVQVYNKYGPDAYSTHTYTWETLTAATAAELKANGVVLDSLDDYLTIRDKVRKCLYGTDDTVDDGIKDFYDRIQNDKSKTVILSEVTNIINEFVYVNECQIICEGNTYKVSGIGAKVGMTLMGKDVDAVITKGVLKDFEQLTGVAMCAREVSVSASYSGFSVSLTAKTIKTSAAPTYTWYKDVQSTEDTAAANKGDYTAVAQDTYGMAIDFWVRTNAKNSYLKLEGNVLTKTEQVRATGVDMNGKIVELSTVNITATITDEETGEETEIDETVVVYYDDNGVLRNAISHSEIDTENESVGEVRDLYEELVTVIGYEGENRIWGDDELLDTSSTTQGAGSCYVFYAEDPAQQENCLRLLSNLRVAFVDNNENSSTYGRVVGLGMLDSASAYEENGKVTIPLVLCDDGSTYLTKNGGELAILPLEQNTATRITAVVYLDGREMSNADVLAANDIQGQLNIQFGSTEALIALGNETLENATRSVSAVASATEGSFPEQNSVIEFSYDDATPMTVYVKLQVDGEQPKNVTAFFMRKVNATQGSREETFTMTQADDGCWYGSYTFDAPGEYVLRTVQLDGVDYDLPATDYPQVKIEGFTISSVSVTYDSQSVTDMATIMTSSRTVRTDLSLTLKSDQKMPKTVKLQFMKDDGTYVTGNLTYNSTTGAWNGTANFTSSGTYTLKYVIMDGEYTELDSDYQCELVIYSGITVSVTDGGEMYRNRTWDGNAYSVPMFVEIFDDSGAEMKYLSGVQLFYTRSGSNVDGMSPLLTWNGSEDSYTGNLLIPGPGIYSFNAVTYGGNTMQSTQGTPPTYTCISPEPPSYMDAAPMLGIEHELSSGVASEVIYAGVRIANAEAATVTATLYDADTKREFTVTSSAESTITIDGEPVSTFLFPLPRPDGTHQSGDWTITKLELADVYDEDANYYGSSNPMEMIPTTCDHNGHTANECVHDLHIKVVHVVMTLVTVKADGSNTDPAVLSETLNGGSFMGTATTQNHIAVKLTDHKGNALNSAYITVSEMKLSYGYVTGSSATHGGYTSDAEANLEDISLTLTRGADGITYVAPTFTLSYAGEYTGKELTFSVSDKNGTTNSYRYTSTNRDATNGISMPKYILQTDVPTVTISAITPTGSNATKITYNATYNRLGWFTGITFYTSEGKTSEKSDYSATVYALATADNDTQKHGLFTQPTLTLKVAGVTSDSVVSLVLPGGDSSDITFSRTGNGTIKMTLGETATINSWDQKILGIGYTHTLQAYYGHGTQTISTMVITLNGATYTITLENPITITNPSSVNQS